MEVQALRGESQPCLLHWGRQGERERRHWAHDSAVNTLLITAPLPKSPLPSLGRGLMDTPQLRELPRPEEAARRACTLRNSNPGSTQGFWGLHYCGSEVS